MEDIGPIVGKEHLVAVFGYWPTFHDAEVLWMRLDRRSSGEGDNGPTFDALVHVFEITTEVSPNGHYVLRHHVLVHLVFREVVELKLDEFNYQNALMGLTFNDLHDRQLERVKWAVRFDPTFGVDASFQCRAIEVVSVVPCCEDGEPLPDASHPPTSH